MFEYLPCSSRVCLCPIILHPFPVSLCLHFPPLEPNPEFCTQSCAVFGSVYHDSVCPLCRALGAILVFSWSRLCTLRYTEAAGSLRLPPLSTCSVISSMLTSILRGCVVSRLFLLLLLCCTPYVCSRYSRFVPAVCPLLSALPSSGAKPGIVDAVMCAPLWCKC